MGQPRPFNRITSYTDYSAANPSRQQPGAQLDAEFDGVKATTDDIRTNLAKLQRDDGKLAAASVGKDQLAPDAVAYLGSTGSADVIDAINQAGAVASDAKDGAVAAQAAAEAVRATFASKTLTELSVLSVPADVTALSIAGVTTVGDVGAGLPLVFDAGVDAAYVAANPTTSFLDAGGRGFRQARRKATDVDASDGNTVQANIDNAGYFTQSGTNTVQRTGASKLKESVSVLDYIPPSEHAAIKAETSTYDCGPAFNQAVIDSLTVLVPQGRYMVGTTIREATNGGARNIIGQNRLKSKLVASPALAASGAPIIWLGNSNGHGNYRLRVQHLYIDGGDTAGKGAAGAIGIRAHEAGTSFVGDLYVTGCSIAIDAIGCIGSSFGGQKTEIYASQKGLWFSAPSGGGVALGGNSTTQTESVLTLNTNINNVGNIWFGSTSKPVRVTGGLTHVHHLVIQSCGSGASDDLIHLLNANESYDYGGGSHISQIWCEGGNYRSIVRIESTRAAKIDKCFFSGAGALCEQGVIIKGSSGTVLKNCSFRGSWSRALTESRTQNASFYVHGDSRNGVYGPNYETINTCTHRIEYAISGHNNIIIDNHNNSNTDKGLTVGNIRISFTSGASTIAVNPDAVSDLGSVNWYLQDPIALNSFRSTGYVRADTQFQISTTKVVGARKTGWATATGTATRTTFDTASVTLPQLAEHVKALIDDLHATAGHGLIGA